MVRIISAQSIQAQSSIKKNTLPCQESLYFFIFYTSTLHLPLAHVSSPISETIYVSPLITTIKKNKIVSLIFNVGLNIFTTSHLPYSLSYLYIYIVTIIHFNYLILKCSNTIIFVVGFVEVVWWSCIMGHGGCVDFNSFCRGLLMTVVVVVVMGFFCFFWW